jgi:hypothetical protein
MVLSNDEIEQLLNAQRQFLISIASSCEGTEKYYDQILRNIIHLWETTEILAGNYKINLKTLEMIVAEAEQIIELEKMFGREE